MVRIQDIHSIPATAMDNGRGETVSIVGHDLGGDNIDIHLNRLRAGGASGLLHRHTKSDNVYIVRRGEGSLVADGKSYTIRPDQVVFIPAGIPHSLSNTSSEVLEIIEIYAPAGRHHDFTLE